MTLKIGQIYLIEHSRKGPFIGKLLQDDGEWVTVEIVKGRAKYISVFNQDRGTVGDKITIRKSFCTFKEMDE